MANAVDRMVSDGALHASGDMLGRTPLFRALAPGEAAEVNRRSARHFAGLDTEHEKEGVACQS
jgi:hypothetical protein